VEDGAADLREDVDRANRFYGAGGIQLIGECTTLDARYTDGDFDRGPSPL